MRIDDSGFRKRTVNNSLMTRQLILSTRGSKKMINAMGTPACTFKQLWDNVIDKEIMLGTQCKAVASIYYKCKGSLTPHWPVFSSRLYNLHATMDDLNRRSRQMSKRRNRRLSRRSQRILFVTETFCVINKILCCY